MTERDAGERGDAAMDAVRQSEGEESRGEARRARASGTIGQGMSSADSTEAPLSAETGEPDDRALGGAGGADDDR